MAGRLPNTDLAQISAKASGDGAAEGFQSHVALKLRELDQQGDKAFGTLLMRQGNKRLLNELDNARAESARLITGAQNATIKVWGDTMVRYAKAAANCHLAVLEQANASNMDGHYLRIKEEITHRLAEHRIQFIAHIAHLEEQIASAPAMLKSTLVDEAKMLIASYLADNTLIMGDYSDIRKNRFK